MRILKVRSSCIQSLIDLEIALGGNLLHCGILEPFHKFGIVPGKGIQQPVHRLVHYLGLVQLQLIGFELPQFAGEGAQNLLEETVYGVDGKGAVVVEYGFKHTGTAVLELVFAAANRRHEIVEIIRGGRVVGQYVQFLQDSGLHLSCGLVGKSHCKYVPVWPGVLIIGLQKQGNIGSCKGVGLSGTG